MQDLLALFDSAIADFQSLLKHRFKVGFGTGFLLAVFLLKGPSCHHEVQAAEEPSSEARAQADARRAKAFEDGRRDFERQFFNRLAASVDSISFGEPELTLRRDGTYDVRLPVTWSIDSGPVVAVMNEQFRTRFDEPIQAGHVSFSRRIDPPNEPSFGVIVTKRSVMQSRDSMLPLFAWLCEQRVHLVVSLGPSSGRLTIAAGRRCNERCRELGDDEYQIQFAHKPGEELLFADYELQDPLTIAHVPAEIVQDSDFASKLEWRFERVRQ